jgi:arylformamidase
MNVKNSKIILEKNQIDLFKDLISNARVIDLGVLLENDMPRFPSHPPIIINPTIKHEYYGYYCQSIFMPEHIGSHVDAPYHIHPGLRNKTIDKVSPVNLIGRAVIIDLSYLNLQPGEFAELQHIKNFEKKNMLEIQKDDIVLINFGCLKKFNDSKNKAKDFKDYTENSPGLNKNIAEYLLSKQIKAIGSDTIACGIAMVNRKESFCWIHELMLKNDILIMECIANLELLPPTVIFMAIPLKIKDGSGSPIRPIALVFP